MKPSTSSPDLKDDDIRALMDAQGPASSPADLDARILAASKEEVKPSTPEGSGSVTRYGSWLAVAAVAVLAVILVPLMQQSDEATRYSEPDAVALNDNAIEAMDATEGVSATTQFKQNIPAPQATSVDQAGASVSETLSLQAESAAKVQAPQVQSNQAQQGVLVTREVSKAAPSILEKSSSRDTSVGSKEGARMKRTDGLVQSEQLRADLEQTVRADSTIAEIDVSDIDAMTDDEIRQTFETHPYRREHESWKKEIIRLESLKETVQVVRERRLFERMYPGEH